MKKASLYEWIGIALIIVAVVLLCFGQFGYMVLFLVVGLCFLVHGVSLATFGIKPKYKLQGVSLYGLPQGETDCICKVYKNSITFEVNKNKSTLELSKVLSAVVKTRAELQKASAGATFAGALFFGVPGAIIASRPKVKNEYIVIINYISSDENRAVAIAVDSTQKYDTENVVHYLNKNTVKTTDTIL